MELKEAFDIIDATLGMFRIIEEEVENGDLKEKFLLTPVYSSIDNVFDVNKNSFEFETKSYYMYVDGDKEYKRYIVDIQPVCSYMINEWPSLKAKKIHKLLNEVLVQCVALCEETLGTILNVALDEGYGYEKYMRTQDSRTLETVMLDTIHEMSHALGLTEYAEPEIQEENIIITDDDRVVTEDLASQMDWVRVTNNFNPDTIIELVKNIGKSKREKMIVIKAIYDSMCYTGELYKISYQADKLLDDLYRKFDNNHKGITDANNECTKTLECNEWMKKAIDEYMTSHKETDVDIDNTFANDIKPVESQNPEGEQVKNLSSTEQLIIRAVEIMKKEKVIKHLYDYAFIMKIMNETEELPTFNSPQSFLNYFKELKIAELPSEDSIKKKVNASFGNHPSWTFTDDKGKDINEVKRRIAVGSRFLSICRKGK